jgi:hypothetical protein
MVEVIKTLTFTLSQHDSLWRQPPSQATAMSLMDIQKYQSRNNIFCLSHVCVFYNFCKHAYILTVQIVFSIILKLETQLH